MKDSIYFSHDANARTDLKIKALIKKYKMEGYGIYWVILENMRVEETYKLEMKQYVLEGICDEIGKDLDFLKKYLDDCVDVFELFISDNEHIWSESFLKRMKRKDAIIELKRKAGQASAAARLGTHVEQPSSKSSTINKEKKQTKETNKEKKESLAEQKKRLLQARKETFFNNVLAFKEKYPEDMLENFFNYWSESNKSGSQMRWEMERTWELPRRLATWARNEPMYKNKDKYHDSDY